MHRLVAEKRQDIGRLCRDFGVLRLEVFGSAARGGDFRPDASDLDFLVEYDPASNLSALDGYFGLREALSDLLDRPVDLVETGAVSNPFVLAGIEKNRELVYAA